MPKTNDKDILSRNERTLEIFTPQWLNNARENARYINEAFASRDARASSVPFNGKDPNRGVVFFGSGPSLIDILDDLKGKYAPHINRHLVVCSPTNYAVLRWTGISPDIIFISDSQPTQVTDIDRVIDHADSTNIVGSPFMHPSIHAVWPDEKIYYLRSEIQLPDGTTNHAFNNFMRDLFRNVPEFVIQAGCVSNQMFLFFVLLKTTLRIAELPRFFLLGMDYAVDEARGLYRTPKLEQMPDRSFRRIPMPEFTENPDVQILVYHDGAVSNPQLYNYRRSFMTLWGSIKMSVYTGSSPKISPLPKYVPPFNLDEVFSQNPKLPDLLTEDYILEKVVEFQKSPPPTDKDGKEINPLAITKEEIGLSDPEDEAVVGSTAEPTEAQTEEKDV